MIYFSASNDIITSDPLPHVGADKTNITNGLEVAFAILGAIAFLVIVVAGLRYIRAGSDTTKVSDSKRQIAHALVGLIVAALAASIVEFVLKKV